jgi:hypothetical protein
MSGWLAEAGHHDRIHGPVRPARHLRRDGLSRKLHRGAAVAGGDLLRARTPSSMTTVQDVGRVPRRAWRRRVARAGAEAGLLSLNVISIR